MASPFHSLLIRGESMSRIHFTLSLAVLFASSLAWGRTGGEFKNARLRLSFGNHSKYAQSFRCLPHVKSNFSRVFRGFFGKKKNEREKSDAACLQTLPKVVGAFDDPIKNLPSCSDKRVVIGVMSSGAPNIAPRHKRKMQRLGRAIAKHQCVFLNGACKGMPDVARRAAKIAGGLTVGVSPWPTLEKHIKEGAPYKGFDVIKMTKLPPVHQGQNRGNFMAREIDDIHHSDAVIFAGGRTGTLGEFAIAFEESKPIGVLLGMGGVSDEFKRILKAVKAAGKNPGAPIIYDHNPERLVERLLNERTKWLQAGGTSSPIGDP